MEAANHSRLRDVPGEIFELRPTSNALDSKVPQPETDSWSKIRFQPDGATLQRMHATGASASKKPMCNVGPTVSRGGAVVPQACCFMLFPTRGVQNMTPVRLPNRAPRKCIDPKPTPLNLWLQLQHPNSRNQSQWRRPCAHPREQPHDSEALKGVGPSIETQSAQTMIPFMF